MVDGRTYEGEWFDDHAEGEGVCKLPCGLTHSGHWKDGKVYIIHCIYMRNDILYKIYNHNSFSLQAYGMDMEL